MKASIIVGIFTEAGADYGHGHLERMRALSQELPKDAKARFFIHGMGFEWSKFERVLESSAFDLIIIDSYLATKSDYERANKRATLLVMDDNARLEYPHKAFVINTALNSKKLYKNYSRRLFAGEQYAPIKPKHKKASKKIEKVLICMGGSDKDNLTQRVADALKGEAYELLYVLGPSYAHKLKAHKILKGLSKSQLFELFGRVDVCILSGGVMLNEALAHALPCVVIQSAPNQLFQISELEKLGAIIKASPESLPGILEGLDLVALRKKASALKYGQGLKRALYTIISEAIKVRRYDLKRLKELSDFVLECRNAQREFMFNQEIISRTEHLEFLDTLSPKNALFVLTRGALFMKDRAELERKVIGVISLKLRGKEAFGGLYKSPFYRDKAGDILVSNLEEAARNVGAKSLILETFKRNYRARALYERSGYEVKKVFQGVITYEKQLSDSGS